MFWDKKKQTKEQTLEIRIEAMNSIINDRDRTIDKLKSDNEMRLREKESEHAIELKEKDFILRHAKDEEIKKLNGIVASRDLDIAVLKKENEMLSKITDLNADIIDIKELVNKLIDKLPSIDLKNLTINHESQK